MQRDRGDRKKASGALLRRTAGAAGPYMVRGLPAVCMPGAELCREAALGCPAGVAPGSARRQTPSLRITCSEELSPEAWTAPLAGSLPDWSLCRCPGSFLSSRFLLFPRFLRFGVGHVKKLLHPAREKISEVKTRLFLSMVMPVMPWKHSGKKSVSAEADQAVAPPDRKPVSGPASRRPPKCGCRCRWQRLWGARNILGRLQPCRRCG